MSWDSDSTVESALECRCGGILEQWGSDLICRTCGQRYCPECGGEIVVEGRCGYCLACAASSCEY